ncbi:hypothetical protein NM208_g7814 [Fusarium decemcellulare]|uniref:Uncharacterized protein n=1 Tax=Fusarium decemcellulare TaxID=57161 RepID=A0ACC1S7N3_9HYPO|nr:hypothetical protein NM208_g7814 [Fusarium decemcellulare]
MTGLRYDPEYFKAMEPFLGGPRPEPPKTVLELRQLTETIITMVVGNSPYPSDVKEKVFTVKSYDGAEIKVTRFASETALASTTPTPAVIYVHGGGFVATSVKMFAPQIARYAHNTNFPYFAVHYRLAPEHPAPAGLEDAFAVLKHILESAQEFNIDPTKIAVHGDSAGGGVAAGVALMARDRKLDPPLAKQILIYPMLDDRTKVEDSDPRVELMGWKPNSNILAWNAYAGESRGSESGSDVLSYAAPARATSLRGLPATYIEVGTLDLFRDEDIEYAARLTKEDVEVEFHLWPGLPHGFDGMMTISWYQRSQESRLSAIKRISV